MSGRFEPKEPVTLDPPKNDPITVEELAKANGKCSQVYFDDLVLTESRR